MTASIPDIIKPLLDEYLALLDERLPGLVGGFYLQGSIAQGAFNERLSDIDFVAFLNRGWTTRDLTALQEIYIELHRKYPRWSVDGLFVEWPGQYDVSRVVVPYLDQLEGKIRLVRDFDLNTVTWRLLKTKGITLRGPEASELGYTVDWEVLVGEMHRNQNTYWGSYTRKPRRMATLLSDWGIEWTVLGTLRQLYTFRENDITTKVGAGEYALEHLPSKWHTIIQEAIRIREGQQGSFYTSKYKRAFEAFSFLRFVRKECNKIP